MTIITHDQYSEITTCNITMLTQYVLAAIFNQEEIYLLSYKVCMCEYDEANNFDKICSKYI